VRPDTGSRTFVEAARRAQLVDCALTTIAEDGYAGASLAAIAARAGVSKGVISYHFTGKDELVAAAFAQAIGELTGYLAQRLAAEPTASGKLRAHLRGSVDFLREHPREVRALLELTGRDGVDPDPAGSDRDGLVGVLRAGQQTGEFRAFAPEVLAATVRGALTELTCRAAADPATDLDRYAGELIDLFDLATRA
jgi:AcrR family transcriptional regulator